MILNCIWIWEWTLYLPRLWLFSLLCSLHLDTMKMIQSTFVTLSNYIQLFKINGKNVSNINQQHNNLLFVVEFLRIRECLSLSIWIRFCSLSTASLGPSNSLPLSSCRLDSWKLANGLSNRWEKRAVTWRAFYIFYIFFLPLTFIHILIEFQPFSLIVWCFFKDVLKHQCNSIGQSTQLFVTKTRMEWRVDTSISSLFLFQ